MLDVDVLNPGTGVSARKNEANFSNVTVIDDVILLLQLIGEDRHRIDITMLHHRLGVNPIFGVIEEPPSINSAFAVLESHMSEDVLNAVVLMLPNKRNLHLLSLVLECAFTDGETISANQTLLSCPTAKVRFHFEGSPSLYQNLQFRLQRLLPKKVRLYLKAYSDSREYRKHHHALDGNQ